MQTRHSSKGRARSRNSDAHWNERWEMLKREGRVEVENPESYPPPPLASSSNFLSRVSSVWWNEEDVTYLTTRGARR